MNMPRIRRIALVLVTAPDLKTARQLAKAVLKGRLAACVNYFPIKSIYWWNEKVEETGEIALIAKTRAELVEKVIRRVKELHSYQVPCVESWAIDSGNPDYLEWIKESTE